MLNDRRRFVLRMTDTGAPDPLKDFKKTVCAMVESVMAAVGMPVAKNKKDVKDEPSAPEIERCSVNSVYLLYWYKSTNTDAYIYMYIYIYMYNRFLVEVAREVSEWVENVQVYTAC